MIFRQVDHRQLPMSLWYRSAGVNLSQSACRKTLFVKSKRQKFTSWAETARASLRKTQLQYGAVHEGLDVIFTSKVDNIRSLQSIFANECGFFVIPTKIWPDQRKKHKSESSRYIRASHVHVRFLWLEYCFSKPNLPQTASSRGLEEKQNK